jgi:hypothetical protein
VHPRLAPSEGRVLQIAEDGATFVTESRGTIELWTRHERPEVAFIHPGDDAALAGPHFWLLDGDRLHHHRTASPKQFGKVPFWKVPRGTRGVVAWADRALTWNEDGARIYDGTHRRPPMDVLVGNPIEELAVWPGPPVRWAAVLRDRVWVMNTDGSLHAVFPLPPGKKGEKLLRPRFSPAGDLAVARGRLVTVFRRTGDVYEGHFVDEIEDLSWSEDGREVVLQSRGTWRWQPETDTTTPQLDAKSRPSALAVRFEGLEVPQSLGPIGVHGAAPAFLLPMAGGGSAWVDLLTKKVVHRWPGLDEAAVHPSKPLLAVRETGSRTPVVLHLDTGAVDLAWTYPLTAEPPPARCTFDPNPRDNVSSGGPWLGFTSDGAGVYVKERGDSRWLFPDGTSFGLSAQRRSRTLLTGGHIVAVQGFQVRMIDAENCRVRANLRVQSSWASLTPLRVDGTFAIADGELYTYTIDPPAEERVGRWSDIMRVAAVDPDHVLALHENGDLSILTLATGEAERWTRIPGAIPHLAVATDGQFAVVAGSPPTIVRLRDMKWLRVGVFPDGGLTVVDEEGRYWTNEAGAAHLRVTEGSVFAPPWPAHQVLAGADRAMIEEFL